MDTTANTLIYAFTLLGMHKNIQEKVYKEVLHTVGLEREILKSDLPHLQYTERVILETLRLFPTVPLVGRRTNGELNLGSKILPKDCDVVLPIYYIHRNKKYWPNPQQFDPDRFLQENWKNLESGAYIPFLIGPKDCLGKTYALTSMKIFLASTIRRYKFSSNHKSIEEFDFRSYITILPKSDIDIKLTPRN